MERGELEAAKLAVCAVVAETAGEEVSPHALCVCGKKGTRLVCMASRLLCLVLHCVYGLPWRSVGELTGMGAERARKGFYEADSLIETDETYRRAHASLMELFAAQ